MRTVCPLHQGRRCQDRILKKVPNRPSHRPSRVVPFYQTGPMMLVYPRRPAQSPVQLRPRERTCRLTLCFYSSPHPHPQPHPPTPPTPPPSRLFQIFLWSVNRPIIQSDQFRGWPTQSANLRRVRAPATVEESLHTVGTQMAVKRWNLSSALTCRGSGSRRLPERWAPLAAVAAVWSGVGIPGFTFISLHSTCPIVSSKPAWEGLLLTHLQFKILHQ